LRTVGWNCFQPCARCGNDVPVQRKIILQFKRSSLTEEEKVYCLKCKNDKGGDEDE
jgi:hypothetical protein